MITELLVYLIEQASCFMKTKLLSMKKAGPNGLKDSKMTQ